MLIGVFSDIHSNLEALTAVFDFFKANRVDLLLCCGDIVGYGPDPQACIEQLRSARIKVVAGNHDWGVTGRISIDHFNHLAARAIQWTKTQLSETEITYLRGLPLILDFGPIHLVHSAPSDPAGWDYIHTLDDAAEEMGAFTAQICLIGHTHIPMAVERIAGQRTRLITFNPFSIRENGKYLINVGGVGQPRDRDPRACCVIIDLIQKQVTFHRLVYDYTITQRKIATVGLPLYLAQRLEMGI